MRVLFVCNYNSARSQFAQAFYNRLSHSRDATSAGLKADSAKPINRPSVIAMKLFGIDISRQRRQQLTPAMVQEAERVVVILTRVPLPGYLKSAEGLVTWRLRDPKGLLGHLMAAWKVRKLVKAMIREQAA